MKKRKFKKKNLKLIKASLSSISRIIEEGEENDKIAWRDVVNEILKILDLIFNSWP